MTELLALIEYLIDFLELILLNRHELSKILVPIMRVIIDLILEPCDKEVSMLAMVTV